MVVRFPKRYLRQKRPKVKNYPRRGHNGQERYAPSTVEQSNLFAGWLNKFGENLMAHEYSVKIHEFISDKLVTVGKLKQRAEERKNPLLQKFYEGQLEELRFIRAHLTKSVDLKTQTYY